MFILFQKDTSLLCGEGNSGSQERGSLELTLLFDAPVRNMTVHVLQARTLPTKPDGPILQSQVLYMPKTLVESIVNLRF